MNYKLEQNREKWIKALRSGFYKQTTCYLQVNDSYCCLGVACDVYEKETGNRLIPGGIGENLEDHPEVKDWLGLNTNEGHFRLENGGLSCLVDLNDVDQLTFEEIADIIELEPKGLFRS